MPNKHLPSDASEPQKAAFRAKGGALSRAVALWIADGEVSGGSGRIVAERRLMFAKFLRFLRQEHHSQRLVAVSSVEVSLPG